MNDLVDWADVAAYKMVLTRIGLPASVIDNFHKEVAYEVEKERKSVAAGLRAGADFDRRCGDCEFADHIGGVQYECAGLQAFSESYRFGDDRACGRWRKRK